jgi:hypothetical protein
MKLAVVLPQYVTGTVSINSFSYHQTCFAWTMPILASRHSNENREEFILYDSHSRGTSKECTPGKVPIRTHDEPTYVACRLRSSTPTMFA